MSKRYIPVLIIFIFTCILAVVGFMLPKPEAQTPVRVLLENSGGNVVFDHEIHNIDYKIDCVVCHHEMPVTDDKEMDMTSILPCSTCHGIDYNEEFVASHQSEFSDPFLCATCHHYQFEKATWDHDFHSEMTECQTCHHDEEIEPEPMDCVNCHAAGYVPSDDPMPSLKTAVHAKCYDCHIDWYDSGMEGCKACHTDLNSRTKLIEDENYVFNTEQALCITCHEDTTANDLIPGRMDAAHESCMGCHEKEQKGPYKPDQCAQCHGK